MRKNLAINIYKSVDRNISELVTKLTGQP
jgi:hypothetical protein